MRKALVALGILALGTAVSLAAPASKSPDKPITNKWLHVRVEDGAGASLERVHVNVPLSLAEAVIPAIQVDGKLQGGKVRIDTGNHDFGGVDFRKVLEALRNAEDGNYVTVDGAGDNVRVAKRGGYLVAKIQEGKGSESRVDVKIPMPVVEALFSGEKDELNLGAAIRALAVHGDGVLVTVEEKDSRVRIWVDSKNESESE